MRWSASETPPYPQPDIWLTLRRASESRPQMEATLLVVRQNQSRVMVIFAAEVEVVATRTWLTRVFLASVEGLQLTPFSA